MLANFSFVCCECGDVYHNAKFLSDFDLEQIESFKGDSKQAQEYLDDNEIICVFCDGEDDDGLEFGDDDVQAFENSGTKIDDGRKVFLRLNY